MKTLKQTWWRITFVLIGALVVTALGIDAADTLRGESGTLLSQVIRTQPAPICPPGMQQVDTIPTLICVDQYEASPSSDCTHREPASILQSEQNVGTAGCYAESKKDVMPWTYVSLAQAQRACAQAGKRLPNADEWYRLTLGTNASLCIVDMKEVAQTGTEACISAAGVYDTIGNVWEWVDAQVSGNTYNGRTLPESGHISSVDSDGIAITTAADPDPLYDNDYFWSKSDGVSGIIRGGFYGSGLDAGPYALNASVPMQFAAQGVGFRCVK